MIILGVKPIDVESAVRVVSEVGYGGNIVIKSIGPKGSLSTSFTIQPRDSRLPGARRSGEGRRIKAACWHAHRDVLLEIFRNHPHAKLRSAVFKCDGLDEFLDRVNMTRYQNVGSQAVPAYPADLCADHCDKYREFCVPIPDGMHVTTPGPVLADWYEDHGQPERAALLRRAYGIVA